ncbi:flagellar basal body-associated FliL family protein [Thermovorax subterraneus]|jgi:flagellar FliL protein|nr:flagellar basal body-associated FliL family protein [Thermovorax subterraneus]
MANKLRSTLKLLVVVILVLLVSTTVTYFIAKNILADNSKKQQENQSITYSLGDYLTNLADRGYVKVSIVCLIDGKEAEKELKKKEYQIKDRVYSVLRSKTYDSLKDSKGMEALKKEIKDTVNKLIENGKIQEVYFTNIIVN